MNVQANCCQKYCNPQFYKSNLSFFLFVFIYILIQIILVIYRVIQYKDSNWAVIIARSAGILLAFNMSFVILLILKRFLTWLGNLKIFRVVFPIDEFLSVHKFIGTYILVLSFIHTIAHCVNQCKF
jgi:hypothetical protein